MNYERYQVLFPFKKFIDTIPMTSVECERIFSIMNLIKDKRKNQLSTINLFYRIVLKVHGGKVESFDYDGAFEIWKKAK